ncbi:MAG: hypothetical protein LBT39_06945, partial [Treponema sp.]|nr:hypothetical protein [Treponema sp.]
MFSPERWAAAFVNALQQDPEAVEQGLALLAAVKPLSLDRKSAAGNFVLSGTSAALHLEKVLRSGLKDTEVVPGTEIALRLVLLLVK